MLGTDWFTATITISVDHGAARASFLALWMSRELLEPFVLVRSLSIVRASCGSCPPHMPSRSLLNPPSFAPLVVLCISPKNNVMATFGLFFYVVRSN